MDKVISFARFKSLRKSIAKKIVLVGGCFDIFHYGHLTFLKKAKQQGDKLVVLLESDETIKNKKNREVFHNQRERAEILAAIEFVDYIIPMEFVRRDEDYLKMVKEIKPALIAVTENDPQIENKKKQAESVGAKIIVVTPLIKKFSSSKIKDYASFSSH
jgi:FAD synthetase